MHNFRRVITRINKVFDSDRSKNMAKTNNQEYTVVMSSESFEKASKYKQELIEKKKKPGKYLAKILKSKSLKNMTDREFLQDILTTKEPIFFAESNIIGCGMDWNNDELSILGDINVAVPVKIYDNMGRGADIKIYPKPFDGELLFSPGCLLRGDRFIGGTEALPDYMEVVGADQKINQEAYNRLVNRRLFPILKYASNQSTINQKAVITIPGMGCGQFAGKFRGNVAKYLDIALSTLLETHSKDLPNIALVRFDPFDECRDRHEANEQYGSISYRVRSLLDNPGKTQLCPPQFYQENSEDFSNCKLFKIVAWDHVSLPGNDFWNGCRSTDDGIAAAATNSMKAFTAIEGAYYDDCSNKFVMPDGSDEWYTMAKPLIATNNLMIVPLD